MAIYIGVGDWIIKSAASGAQAVPDWGMSVVCGLYYPVGTMSHAYVLICLNVNNSFYPNSCILYRCNSE